MEDLLFHWLAPWKIALFSHRSSKTRYGTKVAAISEQHLANLTKETLTKMHTDQSFNLFNANVVHKRQGLVG